MSPVSARPVGGVACGVQRLCSARLPILTSRPKSVIVSAGAGTLLSHSDASSSSSDAISLHRRRLALEAAARARPVPPPKLVIADTNMCCILQAEVAMHSREIDSDDDDDLYAGVSAGRGRGRAPRQLRMADGSYVMMERSLYTVSPALYAHALRICSTP